VVRVSTASRTDDMYLGHLTLLVRYVAVTRARRAVILPPKYMDLARKICETLNECTSTTGADCATSNAACLRARAKLFYNWPLPLLLQPADAPLSPTRVRSLADARTP